MAKASKIHQLVIQSVGGLGDGIASFEGRPVFVPKSAAGDELLVNFVQETKDFIRAEIVEVIKAGKGRVVPLCRHFSDCGGCSLQHLQIDVYEQLKKRIAQNTMQQAGFPEIVPEEVFLPADSRRRAEFKLKQENGIYKLAYLGARSHSKVCITNCIILEDRLQELLPAFEVEIDYLPFVGEIEAVKITAADGGIELVLVAPKKPRWEEKSISQKLQEMAGKLALSRISVVDGKDKLLAEITLKPINIKIGNIEVPLPRDSFLQASAKAADELTNFVLKNIGDEQRVLDLFCGIGTYSLPLAQLPDVQQVLAIDNHAGMIENLRVAANKNCLPLSSKNRDLFASPLSAKELNDFSAVVVNPPRAGAKTQIENIAASKIKKLVMVSCNPATFARDAKLLKSAGFKIKNALAVDQFVYSAHLEIAAYFERN